MDWETWVQQVAGSYLKSRTDAKFQQPYELQKMRLQAYGPFGDLYQEGEPLTNQAGAGGIPPAWLLIGGALLVAVVLVKS